MYVKHLSYTPLPLSSTSLVNIQCMTELFLTVQFTRQKYKYIYEWCTCNNLMYSMLVMQSILHNQYIGIYVNRYLVRSRNICYSLPRSSRKCNYMPVFTSLKIYHSNCYKTRFNVLIFIYPLREFLLNWVLFKYKLEPELVISEK